MKKIITLFLVLCAWTLQAQSLQSQVLANGGMHGETPGGIGLCWTLGGQIETTTLSNASTTLTQGFIQPEYCATLITDISTADYDISIYPNPTKDYLQIQLEPGKQLIAKLINPIGQQLWESKINGSLQVSTSQLEEQVYFLQFYTPDHQLVGTYKILKH